MAVSSLMPPGWFPGADAVAAVPGGIPFTAPAALHPVTTLESPYTATYTAVYGDGTEIALSVPPPVYLPGNLPGLPGGTPFAAWPPPVLTPPSPVILTNNAEGGSNGITATAGNTGGASGNAFNTVAIGTAATLAFDSTRAAHGTLSYQVATAGTATTSLLEWTTSAGAQPTYWFREYLYFTANPAALVQVFRAQSGASRAGGVQVSTAGQIQLFDGTGAGVGNLVTHIPLNAWFRLEGYITGDPAAGVVSCSLYTLMDSPAAAETVTAAAANTTGAVSQLWFGEGTGGAGVGPFWLDDIGVSSAGPLGPAVPTVYASGTAAGAGVAAGAATQAVTGAAAGAGSVTAAATQAATGAAAAAGAAATVVTQAVTAAAAGAGTVTAAATGIAGAAGAGAGAVTDVATQIAGASAAGAGSVTAAGSVTGSGATASAAAAGAVTAAATQAATGAAAGAGAVTAAAVQAATASAAAAGAVTAAATQAATGAAAGAGAVTAAAVQAAKASAAAAGSVTAAGQITGTASAAGAGAATAKAVQAAGATAAGAGVLSALATQRAAALLAAAGAGTAAGSVQVAFTIGTLTAAAAPAATLTAAAGPGGGGYPAAYGTAYTGQPGATLTAADTRTGGPA